MGKKEQIFLKLNIKDYTNHLEKILDKKKFSIDTKNLLLSMLYKIENGYSDYSKTKVEVPSKNDFIENIFSIIQNDCNDIIVAEFSSDASKELKEKNVKYILDKNNGKIIAMGNDLLVLNCILKMKEKTITIPQEKQVLQIPISNMLNLGNRMNNVEVIRDFNGWSWDIALKEVENIDINLIFQTLLYITNYDFINDWIKNTSNLADYLGLLEAHLAENYGTKRADKFMTLLCKLAIDISIENNEEELEFWSNKKKKFEEELEKLQNKQKYLEEKTAEKKDYTKQIEEIDRIINNKELLKQEYTKRNESLPNKEKIFSISHLTDKLGKEREELLDKIKECNELIDPKGYVARKQTVETKVEFLRQLNLEKNSDRRKSLLELCTIFLECFRIKILKMQTKKEVMDAIYKLRYYRFLNLDEDGTKLKDLPKLKSIFEKIIIDILDKAKKLDVIDMITEDEIANQEILANIFDSKIIDLNHMVIQTRVDNNKLYIDYYDEKVLDTTIEIKSTRTIKLKRRTKVFI